MSVTCARSSATATNAPTRSRTRPWRKCARPWACGTERGGLPELVKPFFFVAATDKPGFMTEMMWRVDDRCTNCDVARQFAPGLIEEEAGTSVVVRQPETAAERAS